MVSTELAFAVREKSVELVKTGDRSR